MINVWFNIALTAIAEFFTIIDKSSSRKAHSRWRKTDVSCSSQDKGIRELAKWSATFLESNQGCASQILGQDPASIWYFTTADTV